MPAAAAAPAAGAIILFCFFWAQLLFEAVAARGARHVCWSYERACLGGLWHLCELPAAHYEHKLRFLPALLLASVLLTLATRPLRPETQEA